MLNNNKREKALSIKFPSASDIIEMLEHVGLNINNQFNTAFVPMLEQEVNHEIELMQERSETSSRFQARVRSWIKHRNWKY